MENLELFDRMQDQELREAFCRRKGRFRKSDDEANTALTSYILSNECSDDIRRLKQGAYFPEPPRRIRINKYGSPRKRICFSFRGKDKYLLQLMAHVLTEYKGIYTESLYSYRSDKNHRDFFAKLRRLDPQRKLYVLKLDVHAYGESIDQDILLEKLDAVFADDPEFKTFLHRLLKRNQFYENGRLCHERVSIVNGTPIGTFFSNLYLAELDRQMEDRAALYMRYGDDIAVFTETYEEAAQLKALIFAEFQKLGLECNPEKTAVYAPGETFSVLGIEVSENGYDIAPQSIQKILGKLKRQQKHLLMLIQRKVLTQEEAFEEALRFVNGYFYGTNRENTGLNWVAWAFGIINRTDALKMIDHRTQDFLRSVKSGKSGGARFRTDYEQLRAAGYRSLVYSFYHNNPAKQ